MERKNVKLGMIVLLAGILLVAMVAVNGCKKSTPAEPAAVKPAATAPADAMKVVPPAVDAKKAAEVQKAATDAAKTTADATKTAATEAAKTATEAAKAAKAAAEANALPKAP